MEDHFCKQHAVGGCLSLSLTQMRDQVFGRKGVKAALDKILHKWVSSFLLPDFLKVFHTFHAQDFVYQHCQLYGNCGWS